MAKRRPDRRRRKPVRRPVREPADSRPYGNFEPDPVPEFDEDIYNEDMLSEFSDDTNEFYTDEISERQRRKPRPNEKKAVKKVEKRKPISPTRRKIIHILSYCAIVAVVLIIGVVLSLTVLFKTQDYEITGNTRYEEDAIIDACGISKGENIFLAPKGPAEKKIKKEFPYVEDVTVSFTIPDTIKIAIEEAIEGYLVKTGDAEYLVISTKGRILDKTANSSSYDLPIFIGPTPTSGEVGDYVSYEDNRVVEMIESITQTFADNGYQGITEIDATNMADISFTYEDRIKVKLGIPEDLDYKIRTAMTIITENLDKNPSAKASGTLDVSRCNTTKRSYYNEQAIHPTQNTSGVQPSVPVQGDEGSSDSYDEGGYDYEEDDWSYDQGDNSYNEGWDDSYGYYE